MTIQIGDTVFVPRKLLGEDAGEHSPFRRSIVTGRRDRSITVQCGDEPESEFIATRFIHKRLGVAVVRIGDYSEYKFLDPLYKSVLQFCRILLPDDHVTGFQLRTTLELRRFWELNHGAFEQVIVIGHGARNGLCFGHQNVGVDDIRDILEVPDATPKEFVSLCCQTGRADFSREFSRSPIVKSVIAPFESIHGCLASLFAQHYLNKRLLEHKTITVAFKKARKQLSGSATFRLWINGNLKTN